MGSVQNKKLIVGLDIGTSKVVAIVGEISQEGDIEIVGIGSSPSKGMKKGVVVNIESTVQSIQRAVEEAELMAGCQIHSVFAGIAGNHIRSLNSHGIVAIRDKEVFQPDIDRVIDAAQAVAIPADQKGMQHGPPPKAGLPYLLLVDFLNFFFARIDLDRQILLPKICCLA